MISNGVKSRKALTHTCGKSTQEKTLSKVDLKVQYLQRKYYSNALSVANDILSEIPMYFGELNPKYKFWQDVVIQLSKKEAV